MLLSNAPNFAMRSILTGLLALACMLLAPASRDAAHAEALETLEIKSTDRVFWRGRNNESFLIINVFAQQEKLGALDPVKRNTLLINTALREGSLQLERPETSALPNLNVLFVSMRDMSEYGGSNSNWTQVGTGLLVKAGDKVELKDLKLAGALPSPMPVAPFPYREASATTAASIRFAMPKKIYLVVGEPQTFFYENLVVSKDIEDFVYTPSGNSIAMAAYGRRGLTFTPLPSHVGEHDLAIKVADWQGKTIAEGLTKVVVSPANARWQPSPTEPLRVLTIGHSLPSMYYPAYIADFLAGPGNPDVQFVGGIKYWYGKLPDFRNNPNTDAMAHQASPGYSLRSVLTLYSDDPPANPNMPAKSPFIFKNAEGKPTFDIKRYFAETLNSKPPHMVLLNIGDNDTFGFDPDKPDPALEQQFRDHLNLFLNELRSIAPDAIFGAIMPNTYNYSERSFLFNYGPTFPRFRQIQNRQRYIELMTEVATARGDLQIIPSNFSVDSVDGMPFNSGTHFNTVGARQFASSIYGWMKAQFAQKSAGASRAAAPAAPQMAAAPAAALPTPAQAAPPPPAAIAAPPVQTTPAVAPATPPAPTAVASASVRPGANEAGWLERQHRRILRALSFD